MSMTSWRAISSSRVSRSSTIIPSSADGPRLGISLGRCDDLIEQRVVERYALVSLSVGDLDALPGAVPSPVPFRPGERAHPYRAYPDRVAAHSPPFPSAGTAPCPSILASPAPSMVSSG